MDEQKLKQKLNRMVEMLNDLEQKAKIQDERIDALETALGTETVTAQCASCRRVVIVQWGEFHPENYVYCPEHQLDPTMAGVEPL